MPSHVCVRLLSRQAKLLEWNRAKPQRQTCLGVVMDAFPANQCTVRPGSRRCYTYKILFDVPERPQDSLSPYIRTCLNASFAKREDILYDHHTNFHVSFLGTGGGHPSTDRLPSGTVLNQGGRSFLFDAGEGIQRQIMFSQLRVLDMTTIFISHMHGDHVYGLLGVLLQLNLAASGSEQLLSVQVYGPPGLYNFIATNVALSMAGFNPGRIRVTVFELSGGSMERKPPRMGRQRSIVHSPYPEISNQCLVKKSIDRNNDGTWVIESPEGMSGNGSRREQLQIAAAEVKHIQGVQTFGFVVQEAQPLRNIDAKKAISLGLNPQSGKFTMLKNGHSVESDDGSRQVHPEQVLMKKTKKARKLAILGDNCHVPIEMARLCQDADVLVHEATVLGNDHVARERGHSTGLMAGKVAKSVNARVLVLNHIGAGIRNEEVEQLVAEARSANEDVSHVIPSYDFMEMCVPREGFKFEERTESVEEHAGLRSWWNKIW